MKSAFGCLGKSSQLIRLTMATQVMETTMQNLFSGTVCALETLSKAISLKLGTAWLRGPWFLGSQLSLGQL